VALYILNNKRPFVTDMEKRHSLTITVQASDRMQGANFAIEKSAIQAAPQKTQDRSVVNMEWGFEGEAGAEEAADEVAPAASGEGEDGARRSRRRRRRGKRDDRPEHRSEHRHEHRSHADRPERGTNGNATEDADHEDVAPATDDLNEASELPAGLGDQPQVARSEDDTGEKRGRRRRRGRRGGRRGRDRDGARESGGDEVAAHDGNGAELSAYEEPVPFDPPAEPAPSERHETEREKEYETASAGQVREQTWQAPEAERSPAPEPKPVERGPAPIARAEPIAESAPEDPTRPARKGWWQRKLLG